MEKKKRGDIFTIVIATAEISEIYGISTKWLCYTIIKMMIFILKNHMEIEKLLME